MTDEKTVRVGQSSIKRGMLYMASSSAVLSTCLLPYSDLCSRTCRQGMRLSTPQAQRTSVDVRLHIIEVLLYPTITQQG